MAGVMEAFLAARQQAAQQQNQQLGMLAQLAQLQGASADREMKAQLMPLQIQRERSALEKLARDTAEQARVRELTAQLPAAFQSGDRGQILGLLSQINPTAAAQYGLPKPRENTIVGPGSTVLGPDNQPVFTAPMTPKEPTESELTKLIRERNALPPNDPNRAFFEQKIRKLTTHQPPVNVYSTSLTAGVDAQGNPVFVQPSGQPGVAPRRVPGVFPPEHAVTQKAADAAREGEVTAQNVRERIAKMGQLIQGGSITGGVVGPLGIAGRVAETAIGTVNPSVPTPAIDYDNEKNLLLADVRKLVEKDPNLSTSERETLYRTLGGGTMQTPGSALRTLNNVLEYVERKAATNPAPRRRATDAPVAGPPAVGTVMDGFRFKGGNPADKANWETL